MAYQNYNRNNNYYGWRSPSDEYQVYDPPVEATYHSPRHHHHKKGHVAFRTNYEDSIAEVESNVEAREHNSRLWNHSAYKSVDQEAEAFIQYEHKRMELARLMSTRAV